MPGTDVVVVGAGQAGLAASRHLAVLGIDHVVLERGRVAERWRSTTWDSLRLVTPNWMTRLPGWHYRGPDPDGFMARDEIIDYFVAYAGAIAAPVVDGSPVTRLGRAADGYVLTTPKADWTCRAVVIATGHCDKPALPASARALSPRVHQLHSSDYRRPDALPPGNVLVVGASASGMQIAYELACAGRGVTLAVGRYTSVPRTLLGRDIYWWLDRTGMLDQRVHEVPDITRARAQPALQLAGRADGLELWLGVLQQAGVRLAGHFAGGRDDAVGFADDLAATVRHAESKRDRVVGEILEHARQLGLDDGPHPVLPRLHVTAPPTTIDLRATGISSVVWATGFRRDFDWIDIPVTDASGDLVHDDGVLPVPGLYALGFRFMRRRCSSFIDGVGADAAFIAGRVAVQFGLRRAA